MGLARTKEKVASLPAHHADLTQTLREQLRGTGELLTPETIVKGAYEKVTKTVLLDMGVPTFYEASFKVPSFKDSQNSNFVVLPVDFTLALVVDGRFVVFEVHHQPKADYRKRMHALMKKYGDDFHFVFVNHHLNAKTPSQIHDDEDGANVVRYADELWHMPKIRFSKTGITKNNPEGTLKKDTMAWEVELRKLVEQLVDRSDSPQRISALAKLARAA